MSSDTEGVFIVFEGLDGCGKDTLKDKYITYLQEQGYKVKEVSNIDHGPLNHFIRDMVTEGSMHYITNLHLAMTILSNMVINYHTTISKYIQQGYIVIASRWDMSSLAYGGMDDDKHYQVIRDYLQYLDITADAYIFVDAEPEVALSRITNRNTDSGHYDKLTGLKKIKTMYEKVIVDDLYVPDTTVLRIDANGTIDEVYDNLQSYELNNIIKNKRV